MPALIFVPLLIDILLIWATVSVARSKGREPLPWGILAFFFPLITLIIVAVLPPADARSYD